MPVCAVVRWRSRFGVEPTAKRRGLDGQRTTVEHDLRAGEGIVQIDHLRFEASGGTGNPLIPTNAAVVAHVDCAAGPEGGPAEPREPVPWLCWHVSNSGRTLSCRVLRWGTGGNGECVRYRRHKQWRRDAVADDTGGRWVFIASRDRICRFWTCCGRDARATYPKNSRAHSKRTVLVSPC